MFFTIKTPKFLWQRTIKRVRMANEQITFDKAAAGGRLSTGTDGRNLAKDGGTTTAYSF